MRVTFSERVDDSSFRRITRMVETKIKEVINKIVTKVVCGWEESS